MKDRELLESILHLLLSDVPPEYLRDDRAAVSEEFRAENPALLRTMEPIGFDETPEVECKDS